MRTLSGRYILLRDRWVQVERSFPWPVDTSTRTIRITGFKVDDAAITAADLYKYLVNRWDSEA